MFNIKTVEDLKELCNKHPEISKYFVAKKKLVHINYETVKEYYKIREKMSIDVREFSDRMIEESETSAVYSDIKITVDMEQFVKNLP